MNATEDKLKTETRAKLIESIKLNDEEIVIYKEKLEKIRPTEKVSVELQFDKPEEPVKVASKVTATL